MPRELNLQVSEGEAELKALLRQEKNVKRKERLQALYLYQTGQATSLADLGAALARDRLTIYRWFRMYREQGLSGFLDLGEYAGRAPLIPESIKLDLQAKLSTETGFKSYVEIQNYLQATYGLEVGYHVVYRLVHIEMGAKLKVPRPRHLKQDPEKIVSFKKTYPPKSSCLLVSKKKAER